MSFLQTGLYINFLSFNVNVEPTEILKRLRHTVLVVVNRRGGLKMTHSLHHLLFNPEQNNLFKALSSLKHLELHGKSTSYNINK